MGAWALWLAMKLSFHRCANPLKKRAAFWFPHMSQENELPINYPPSHPGPALLQTAASCFE